MRPSKPDHANPTLPVPTEPTPIAAVRVVRVPSLRPLLPWGETDPSRLPLLDATLGVAQERALAACGLTLQGGSGLRTLVISDRVWFTADLLRRVLRLTGRGQVQMTDAGFWTTTGPLQEVRAPGALEIALLGPHEALPEGPEALEVLFGPGSDLPLLPLELGLRDMASEVPKPHPTMAHAVRPLHIGLAMAHGIFHWSHLLRANQLALGALGEEAKDQFARRGPFGRLWAFLRVFARAGSIDPVRIAQALTETGTGCRIHPTATVEACKLGNNVQIGAMAVVRGCVLGDGARVEEHATVVGSVLGAGAHVGRYGFANLCTLFPGARLSAGGGYQMSIFGEDSFMAWGATALDMSFGRTIQVDAAVAGGSSRVDSGHHLLGVAIGHRAVVGNQVRLQHGASVPNDAVLVGNAADLYRTWGEEPVTSAPHRVEMGHAVPLRTRA